MLIFYVCALALVLTERSLYSDLKSVKLILHKWGSGDRDWQKLTCLSQTNYFLTTSVLTKIIEPSLGGTEHRASREWIEFPQPVTQTRQAWL